MEQTILIKNVRIFNGTDEKTVMGDILILNNRINKIAEPGTISAEGTIIDGKGKFLMPGLIDAHWHSYMCCNTMIDLLTAETYYTQLKAGVEAGKNPNARFHYDTGCRRSGVRTKTRHR